MTTREILTAARALVAQGWTQGLFRREELRWTDETGPHNQACYCSAGAVLFASNGERLLYGEWGEKALLTLAAILDPDWRETPDNTAELVVTDYNDAHGRTQAQVLALFDRAIANTEEE